MCYLLLLESLSDELFLRIFEGIIIAVAITILGAIAYFGRRKISNWWFGRKIKPKLKQALEIYEKEILPEYVTIKPKITPIQEKSEIPPGLPYGYIFVPKGQEELIWQTLIAYLPVSSSLRTLRILFDQNLRESLFDVLSYQLGMKLGKEEIAVQFRDIALSKHTEDFETMERIYSDGKLTHIILWEASIRFRQTGGDISTSHMKEFSKLVRKISKIDAIVVRIGKMEPSKYVERIIKLSRGVVLLARGKNISNAVDVANQLREKGYKLYPQKELGFSNPEIGTWHFEQEGRKKSLMRIWLKKKS